MNKLYVSDAVRIEQLQRRAERSEELARSLAAEVERLQLAEELARINYVELPLVDVEAGAVPDWEREAKRAFWTGLEIGAGMGSVPIAPRWEEYVEKRKGELVANPVPPASGTPALPLAEVDELRPCRSPFCECDVGKCTHPHCYDARGEK